MSDKKGTALVTGGSRGIGRAISIQLARDGYDISLCYRSDEQAARQVEAEIASLGRQVYAKTCDVSQMELVQAFCQETEERLGPPDVLVNCAGIIRDSPLVLMDSNAWHAVLDTNLSGTFNVCRSVVFGFMKRKHGVIINISSVAGVHGNAGQANYSAAKAGIIGLSKALAKELVGFNIRVNVVAPGFIETDMITGLDGQVRDRAIKKIPMRRCGEPQEVADLVSFLVSDRARYITGQTIQVDGGIVL